MTTELGKFLLQTPPNLSTSYTKMGYAGNNDPAFIIPSAISDKLQKVPHWFSLWLICEGAGLDLKDDKQGELMPEWAFGFLDRGECDKVLEYASDQLSGEERADFGLGDHGETVA